MRRRRNNHLETQLQLDGESVVVDTGVFSSQGIFHLYLDPNIKEIIEIENIIG